MEHYFFQLFAYAPITVSLMLLALGVGTVIHILGLISTIQFAFTRAPKLNTSGKLPGVTILKPCREAKDNEEENFDGFFNQNYPGNVELLFIVADMSHPVVPIIQKYIQKYPNRDARLLISTSKNACSPKINSLYDGHHVAKHEIIIWSDSDVIVRPEYVSEMVASLQQPGCDLVTTPQYDTRANTFGSAFKVLANNCDLAVFVMAYRMLNRRKKIAWGHSAGFWKADFDSFGEKAWSFLNRYFADDLGLPILYDQHGKKVVFQNIYCPVETSNKTVAQMVEQKRRWVVCQRAVVGNKLVYLLGMFSYPQIPALFLVLLSLFNPLACGIFVAVAVMRIAISAIFEKLYLNSLRMSIRYFWTIVLWDISQIYFFWYGFSTQIITFRGQKYKILANHTLVPELDVSLDKVRRAENFSPDGVAKS